MCGARVCTGLTGLLECALACVEKRQSTLLIGHRRPLALPNVRAKGDRKRRDAVEVRCGVLSDLVASVLLVACEVFDEHALDRSGSGQAALLAAQQRVQHLVTAKFSWDFLAGARRLCVVQFEMRPALSSRVERRGRSGADLCGLSSSLCPLE